MESTANLKQIKIKTGVLNRNVKDYRAYQKESEKQTEKLEVLKQTSDDAGKIRQNEEALAETIAMLPNCKSRIDIALDDLEATISSVSGEDLESEEMKNAEKAIADANEFKATI